MKYIIPTFILLCSMLFGATEAHASITLLQIPYNAVSCSPGSAIPSANAGEDQTIYTPTSTTTLTGTVANGCPTWKQIYGPVNTTVVNPTSTTTVINGLTATGTYGFLLTDKNSSNQTATDVVQVIVSNGGPDLVASVTTPTSATRATATTIQATITNQGNATTGSSSFTNLFQFDADGDHTSVTGTQTVSAGPLAAGANATVSTSYTFSSSGTWYVRVCADNNASFTGTVDESNTNENNNCSPSWTTVTVSPNATDNGSCAATHYSCTNGTSTSNTDGATQWTWTCTGFNGGTNAQCSENKPVTINGMCAATHYACTSGTSTDNVEGMNAYTWTCAGANGGTDDSCSETIVGGTDCSNLTDDDGDGKIDLADPGCSSSDDDDETNPKPIFIEF